MNQKKGRSINDNPIAEAIPLKKQQLTHRPGRPSDLSATLSLQLPPFLPPPPPPPPFQYSRSSAKNKTKRMIQELNLVLLDSRGIEPRTTPM
ncbi:uncharacterized protein K452DRAFT_53380 [Aplosporella prunicola CBS 121167]|uniref:Uncharacterized protein n=1 Tax=Aplosporella prunicola CBS 121167 TaxID=1176127 RepID=A0A6A6BAE8_9PEZI|nr:uncharacterized protein K452DRAFT_53380 [Aplosporella prunicola CBS 121167]KAF2140245.1 hypothetical protein K452DRAFT_53380 [Aplosporella prunicola CBS 121167]